MFTRSIACSAFSRVQTMEGTRTSNSHPISLLIAQVLSALRGHSRKKGKRPNHSVSENSHDADNPIQLTQIHWATHCKLKDVPPRNLPDIRQAGKPKVRAPGTTMSKSENEYKDYEGT